MSIPAEEAVDPIDMTPEQLFRTALEQSDLPAHEKAAITAEISLRIDLSKAMNVVAERVAAGEAVTYDEIGQIFDSIAQQHGIVGGIPMPHVNAEPNKADEHPLVLARQSALGRVPMIDRTWDAAEMNRQGIPVRNSWHRLSDATITVVDTEQGPMSIAKYHAGAKLQRMIKELAIRSDVGSMTAEAELRALESLKTRVKSNQYRTYVLSNTFVEHSPKSDLYYFFRKGRPTIVVSYHGTEAGKAIAALCMHPTGYYAYSHCGVMVPTDEVIAALLLMRSDEHRFWRVSGQWHMADPRAGL